VLSLSETSKNVVATLLPLEEIEELVNFPAACHVDVSHLRETRLSAIAQMKCKKNVGSDFKLIAHAKFHRDTHVLTFRTFGSIIDGRLSPDVKPAYEFQDVIMDLNSLQTGHSKVKNGMERRFHYKP
jgi:hypothetical protein